MGYQLGADEPIGHGLKRVLIEEIASARAVLDGLDADRDRAVHQARRHLKRARSLLSVFASVIGPDFRRRKAVLREAAKLLSGARDADVAVASVRRLGRPGGKRSGLPRLVSHLEAEATAAHREAADFGRVAALLRMAEADAASLPVVADGRALLVDALVKAYRRGRRAAAAAAAGADPEALHDWRKRVKHRWHLTLLVPGWCKATRGAVARDLDGLAECLGDEHDLALVADRLAREPGLAGGDAQAEALIDRLDRRRRKLRKRAVRQGTDLYREPARKFSDRLASLAVASGPPRPD